MLERPFCRSHEDGSEFDEQAVWNDAAIDAAVRMPVAIQKASQKVERSGPLLRGLEVDVASKMFDAVDAARAAEADGSAPSRDPNSGVEG